MNCLLYERDCSLCTELDVVVAGAVLCYIVGHLQSDASVCTDLAVLQNGAVVCICVDEALSEQCIHPRRNDHLKLCSCLDIILIESLLCKVYYAEEIVLCLEGFGAPGERASGSFSAENGRQPRGKAPLEGGAA